MKIVVVEISDDLYRFLSRYFNTNDVCKIVRDLIEEGAVETGLAIYRFKGLNIKETDRC